MSLTQSAKDLIEYIDAFKVRLNPVQKNALENIRRQVECERIINLNQLRVLEDIYRRVTGGGKIQHGQRF